MTPLVLVVPITSLYFGSLQCPEMHVATRD